MRIRTAALLLRFYSSPAIFLCIECVRVKRRAILIACCQHGPLVIATASRARASLRHRCWFKRICCVKIRPLDNFQFMLKSLVITCKHEKSLEARRQLHASTALGQTTRARPACLSSFIVCLLCAALLSVRVVYSAVGGHRGSKLRTKSQCLTQVRPMYLYCLFTKS